MRFRWPGGFRRSLLSILIGNAIYYGLMGYLPGAARHEPFAFDWGLAVDLWICVCVYGLSRLVWPIGKRRSPARISRGGCMGGAGR